MQHVRPTRNAPRIPTNALAAALGLALLVLVGCTMVGDNLTGVGLTKTRPADCFHACKYDEWILQKAEHKLYLANLEACNGDQACIAAEHDRHRAERTRLRAARFACQASCHSQGTGSAG